LIDNSFERALIPLDVVTLIIENRSAPSIHTSITLHASAAVTIYLNSLAKIRSSRLCEASMRLWSGRGVLGLSPVPIPNRSVRFPIGLTGAAPTVIAALAGLTWIFWGDHAGAAVLGPTGILAVGAFVMVAEIRARAASRLIRSGRRASVPPRPLPPRDAAPLRRHNVR
jgi:hypothetical protein